MRITRQLLGVGLVLLLPLLLTSCEMSPRQARRELVDMGYSYGRNDFADCVAKGDSAGLELFLLAGMDPGIETRGYTILEHAAGRPAMVARLLQAGADPTHGGGVSTPLIEAIGKGSGEAVALLLAAGADPNGADGTRRTPLMAAVEGGDTAMARLLLDAGADANARSRLGTTPLSSARGAGHTALIELLVAAGARDTRGPDLEALMTPESLTARAPERFEVIFQTSAGDFRVEVTRAWAPRGADRFYNLVTHGFFDGQRFFRIVRDRLVQFGLHGRPELAGRWYAATIADDPVTQSHAAGTLAFANGGGANSRTTQVFINLADNPDFGGAGLAPFGRVVDGLETVRRIEPRYGETPQQGRIVAEGNEYLRASFTQLDTIRTARLAD